MFEPRVTSAAAERLRMAIEARTRAEIEEAQAIADLAAEHQWDENAQFDVIGTRPVRVGGDGTLLVDEFLPLEVAALKQCSVAAATWLIRDVVNLKSRHPLLWRQATHGRVPVYRACQLAAEVARFDLSLEEARELDANLAASAGTVSWRRLLTLARGLVTRIAPEKAAQLSRDARADRFVRKLPTDDPSVAYLSARVDTADAIFFDAMVDRIADLLGERGDTDPKDVRRARSLGILATPARAQLLLAEACGEHGPVAATDGRLLPESTVYVHVNEETLLHGHGAARVEGVGALSASLLSCLLGHSRVRVTPVVHVGTDLAVDSYEIPNRIRHQVVLRDGFEVFPFSSRSARKQDLDHTEPYRSGVSGQTRPGNLGPVSRAVHRAKTFGGWRLRQPRPGVFWWRSPAGLVYRVTPRGTARIVPHPRLDPDGDLLWRADLAAGEPPP